MKEDLSVTIVQPNLLWQDTRSNLDNIANLLKNTNKTDIILLPEMFNTSFCPNKKELSEEMNGNTINWMKSISSEKSCSIAGTLMIKEKGKIHNRLIWISSEGNIYCYDKRHLFSLINEEKYIQKGKKRIIISEYGWKICPLICYDLRFPVFSRNNTDYDVLIYLSNWPETRMKAWKILLQARAIENQCYTIGVNRIGTDNNISFSGESMILNSNGKILNKISANNQKVETVILQKKDLIKNRIKYPFLKDRDLFTLKN